MSPQDFDVTYSNTKKLYDLYDLYCISSTYRLKKKKITYRPSHFSDQKDKQTFIFGGPYLTLKPISLGRMRTPVREAFSYGIRHRIRHIHCDSMKYKGIPHWITMNMRYPVPYPVWKCLPYGSTHPPYCLLAYMYVVTYLYYTSFTFQKRKEEQKKKDNKDSEKEKTGTNKEKDDTESENKQVKWCDK